MMSEILFISVLKTFANIDYPSIEPNFQRFLLDNEQSVDSEKFIQLLRDSE
jgi:hypothetical protein